MSFTSVFGFTTAIIGGFSIFSGLLLTPFLFFIRLFGVTYYTIRNDEDKVRIIIKALQKTTTSSGVYFQYGNYFPSGYFIGPYCAGYYEYSRSRDIGSSGEVYIITTKSYLDMLLSTGPSKQIFKQVKSDTGSEKTPLIEEVKEESMSIYCRNGSYTNIYYNPIRLDMSGLEPRGQQQKIVDEICSSYEKTKRGVFFIHGICGAGKSTIGLLVAKKLEGNFCHSFNPTDPGNTLHQLINDTDPCEDTPLVIVLEEINIMIRHVNEGLIERHKNVMTSIVNKSTYNTFMDDLILYKHIIFILTSNESRDAIDQLDPCYLRKGRVDATYSMMDPL
jgi:hypothetical protein